MDANQLLSVIQSEGLMIRQIPLEIKSKYSIKNHKEGNEIVKEKVDLVNYSYDNHRRYYYGLADFEYDDASEEVFRLYSVETRIPTNAGFWMCKKSINTSSSVEWDNKKDNIAATLVGSIELYLKRKNE